MKKYACQYAIVRFLPYLETGEFANVGIVLFCPETKYFDYKLIPRARARITNFFEELDGKVYREALETFEWELSRIKDYFHEWDGDVLKKHVLANIFVEFTRPRETMLRFDSIRTKLCEDPEREIENVFSHYVERNFATKKYQEKLLEKEVRKVLKTGQVSGLYRTFTFGHPDTYHATFPFVYVKDKIPVKAIKPLSLDQKEPTKIFDHGWLWMAKIGKLKDMRLLPDELLIPVQGPTEATGPRVESFKEIMHQLKNMALVVETKERQKILEFARQAF
jgi:Protein of unknown function (DUF3037)